MPDSASRRRRPRATFRRAVESVGPPVSGAFEPGIQALQRSHRARISYTDSHLTGSIDLDAALRETHPNAPRWDYAIGFRHSNRERAVWVEVHGAQTSRVREVLNKRAG